MTDSGKYLCAADWKACKGPDIVFVETNCFSDSAGYAASHDFRSRWSTLGRAGGRCIGIYIGGNHYYIWDEAAEGKGGVSCEKDNYNKGSENSPLEQPVAIRIEQAYFSTITSLGEKGPCIIVGRCADYILKMKGRISIPREWPQSLRNCSTCSGPGVLWRSSEFTWFGKESADRAYGFPTWHPYSRGGTARTGKPGVWDRLSGWIRMIHSKQWFKGGLYGLPFCSFAVYDNRQPTIHVSVFQISFTYKLDRKTELLILWNYLKY